MGKFFVPLLKPFTSNNYRVKDSFDFANDITQQSSKLFMVSLDADSVSTNVPLDEASEIVLTNYLNLVKQFQPLTNNKFRDAFVN